jgi:hypothetical protein
MLFGDIDWNQVLMKGIIGAVIGGVVGLVIGLVKLAAKKPPKDDSGKNNSDKAE